MVWEPLQARWNWRPKISWYGFIPKSLKICQKVSVGGDENNCNKLHFKKSVISKNINSSAQAVIRCNHNPGQSTDIIEKKKKSTFPKWNTKSPPLYLPRSLNRMWPEVNRELSKMVKKCEALTRMYRSKVPPGRLSVLNRGGAGKQSVSLSSAFVKSGTYILDSREPISN